MTILYPDALTMPVQAVPRFYRLFNRVIRSDLPLAGLSPCAEAAFALDIRRGQQSYSGGGDTVFELYTSDGKLNYRLARVGPGYAWTYAEAGTFVVAREGSSIEWCVAASAEDDASALLSGPILGFAMQLAGQLGLHGTSLVYGAAAFGLLAPSGFGKSTLGAFLLSLGCSHLSDDVLAVDWRDSSPVALPGSRQVKLWPDSLGHIKSSGGTRFVSWLDKQTVDSTLLGVVNDAPAPLRGLFVLDPRLEPVPLNIMRLAGLDALTALVAHTYQGHLLTEEKGLQLAHLDAFQELARSVPVYVVSYTRAFDTLRTTAEAILAAVKSLSEDGS